MSANSSNDGKLQQLIEKGGGWAAMALVSLLTVMYTNDKAALQMQLVDLNKQVVMQSKQINRLQEGKASRAELKEMGEAFTREVQNTRQDIKDQFSTLRQDIIQRMDLIKR